MHPGGYTFRAADTDDLDAVAGLLLADDLDDVGESVLDADFVAGAWHTSGFDLHTDAWVILDGEGVLIGYGHAMLEGTDLVDSWGVIHPRHRGRGLGPALLDRIEARAKEQLSGVSGGRFRQAVNANDAAAAAMLERRGLQPIRHFWHMGIDLDGQVDPGPAPDGIEITGIDPDRDLPVVHAVLTTAFADDWDYHPEPLDQWIDGYVTGPNYDPSLWLLARDGQEAVGALAANVFGDRGWVGELGVVASHRGRGIGGAMLRRSFVTFADRGFGRVMLNVDAQNPTGATALYERSGMRVVKRWDLWERPIGTPA